MVNFLLYLLFVEMGSRLISWLIHYVVEIIFVFQLNIESPHRFIIAECSNHYLEGVHFLVNCKF